VSVDSVEQPLILLFTGEENVDKLVQEAKKKKLDDKIIKQTSYGDLAKSIDVPQEEKYFVFSIPHGPTGDKVIEGLLPHLKKGDILIDASNEHWERTERRQAKLEPEGIHYIGMGVSGGYQSARHGPSCSPGGTPEALKKVMPFLEQFADKDKKDRPCVVPVGPGGSGHYVKMVHNGIEQAMMSIIAEVWAIMHKGLGMPYIEIADVFTAWNKDGPLNTNFLVAIGADILRTKHENGHYVLDEIRDKVVQDVDNTEGTGMWTCEEAAHLHISAPTIATAHAFRCASAGASAREKVVEAFKQNIQPPKFELDDSKEKTIQMLQDATYSSFLMSYIQGLHIIRCASDTYKWDLDCKSLMQLWRGGCIIQSDYIVALLESVFEKNNFTDDMLLTSPNIASEMTRTFPGLKRVVLKSMEYDHFVPALSASLEWYKYNCSTDLPTQFMEAELDYFGHHNYDLKTEALGTAKKGQHHYEWKPALGIREKPGAY
jgi:6-phosphogluconate dehydrogenase